MDINSLDRFIDAQRGIYPIALAEIVSGQKRSHWMWFIFPQLRGLGTSDMAYTYGISGLDEARAYLAHPVLSERLIEISGALLAHGDKTPSAILGPVDAMKLQSSMTLFSVISENDSVFHKVLEQFYGGNRDTRTLQLLGMA